VTRAAAVCCATARRTWKAGNVTGRNKSHKQRKAPKDSALRRFNQYRVELASPVMGFQRWGRPGPAPADSLSYGQEGEMCLIAVTFKLAISALGFSVEAGGVELNPFAASVPVTSTL
jgi:hypothetical protein